MRTAVRTGLPCTSPAHRQGASVAAGAQLGCALQKPVSIAPYAWSDIEVGCEVRLGNPSWLKLRPGSRTAPYLPPWTIRILGARLRTPERPRSSLEVCSGFSGSPQTPKG